MSLKNISTLSPSNCEATSIKYLELKLISKSWSNFTFNVSLPSPLFVLLTERSNLSFDKLNLTPSFLCGVATDSHRLSSSSLEIESSINIEPIILPKKTIFQLCSLLESYDGDVKVSNIKSKIKFELNNSILISKLIDGKFPNYIQVIPKNNQKKLEIDLKLFLNSVDRVASVSLDKKDGVKFNLSKDTLDLSVNNTNSGDGKETLNVKFDHDLEISFNSRYLIDVASQLDGERVEIFFNDTGSPALIKDPGDFDSIFVVMPMKG